MSRPYRKIVAVTASIRTRCAFETLAIGVSTTAAELIIRSLAETSHGGMRTARRCSVSRLPIKPLPSNDGLTRAG